jgi:hypothetical protein
MLDHVFETFFRSYEQYQSNLAAWDAKYGQPAGPVSAAVAPAPR